jgi:hypothetical protein
MTTFTYHSDPGHGWLEVPIQTLLSVGLAPSDFSAYSYQHRDKVYLEEDCDAAVFIRTYEQHVGPFVCTDAYLNYDHWIRRLRRIESVTDDDIGF